MHATHKLLRRQFGLQGLQSTLLPQARGFTPISEEGLFIRTAIFIHSTYIGELKIDGTFSPYLSCADPLCERAVALGCYQFTVTSVRCGFTIDVWKLQPHHQTHGFALTVLCSYVLL